MTYHITQEQATELFKPIAKPIKTVVGNDHEAIYFVTDEQLQAYANAVLDKVLGEQWISVEDRLPEIGEKVLMRVSCLNYFNVEEGQRSRDNDWTNCWCHRRCPSVYPVTHWMPLPNAPKELP